MARYIQPSDPSRRVQGAFNPLWQATNWLGNLYNNVFPEYHPMDSLSDAMAGSWWNDGYVDAVRNRMNPAIATNTPELQRILQYQMLTGMNPQAEIYRTLGELFATQPENIAYPAGIGAEYAPY